MDWTRVGCAGLVLLASGFLCDAAGQNVGLGEVVDRQNKPVDTSAPEEETELAAVTGMESLTLEQRVGQLMFTTLESGYGPSRSDMTLLNMFPPGGVIILGTPRPSDTAKYVAGLRSLSVEKLAGLPLFIATDSYAMSHSGRNKAKAFAELPSMLSIAAANSPELTRALAAEIAREMTIMGFNMHLGPSLSLDSRISPTSGSIQLFGSSPEIVASIGGFIFSAFNDNDMLWAPMGFPGGAAAGSNSAPAVLLTPEEHLATRDLLPYARAVKAGAKIIHVGNTLVNTQYEGLVPASLSATVMKEWLRGDLGFEGLIVAGPMDGNEIKALMDTSDAAQLAMLAGADMLLWKNSGTRVLKAIQALSNAIQAERFDENIVVSALDRQVKLKEDSGLLERPIPEEKEATKLEKEIAKLEMPYLVERRSITLVQNRGGVLPLDEELSMPIGVTGILGVEELEKALENYFKTVASYRMLNSSRTGHVQDFELDRLTRNARGIGTVICVFSNIVKLPGQLQIIRLFKLLGAKVVVVYVGYPSRVAELSEADAVVLAYSNPASVGKTMIAVADVLVGNGPIDIFPAKSDLKRAVNEEIPFDVADVIRSPVGRLPVTIDETFVAGYSVSYMPQLALKKVRWDFGDGIRSSEASGSHSFRKPGRYIVRLTVTDSMDNETVGEFPVSIK